MHEYTPQQLEMLERFRRLKVGALFSQMGTGKTRVALELVKYNNPDFLLYICPFSCKDNIEKEFRKWGVSCPYMIVGYETLSSSVRIFMKILNSLEKHHKAFIIADESIFIKNGATKRFQRSLTLRGRCEYALILNGTPIVKNERDIYNQMEFLSPEIFKMRYWQFMRTFFIDHCRRHNGKEFHTYTFYEKNRPVFSKIIEPYTYMADLVFEKGEKEQDLSVPFVSYRYDYAKEEYLQKYCEYDVDSMVALFTRLASIAAEDGLKNEEVAKYIKGKKVIVYCSRKEEQDQIASFSGGFRIGGDTPEKERKRIVEEWEKRDDMPLILSFGVGAYSLNLQSASEIVYASLTFNYGQYEQSRFRIKRLGQESDITYTYMLPDCGICRMMKENLRDKKSTEEVIKKHILEGDAKKWIKEQI